MPNFKKNQMNQIMFVMVDKTDFATVESGITASDFNSAATKKIFGVNHGVSDAFASATISKATTLVHSGIFQQTLKASECNYDYLVVRFSHPSCADQILVFQPQEIDPSDMFSMISDFQSDFGSRVPKLVATSSQLSDLSSDLRSVIILNTSTLSDIQSYLVAMSGMLSDIRSNVSDLDSNFQSRVPKEVASKSLVSDVSSDLRSLIAAGVPISASDMSDIRSAVAGVTATLSVSDISDIASAVNTILASNLSDILSAAQQTNSRVLVVQSNAGNIYSLLSDVDSNFQSRVPKETASKSLVSDVSSDLRSLITAGVSISASDMSDIRSAIGGVTATLTPSDISDIASAVDTVLASRLSDILSAAQQGNSRVLVVQSSAGNIYSLLSDVDSNFQSRVPKEVASKSLVSDVNSDLASKIGGITVTIGPSDVSDIASAVLAGITTLTPSDISDIASAVKAILASDMSDIMSAAQQGNSRVLVVQSSAGNIYSLLSDVQSDFQSRVPKAVATNSQLSDLASDLRSYLVGMSGMLSDIRSNVSDLDSNFQSRVPKEVASKSLVSDVSSDLASKIGGITVALSASDISDIASAVNGVLISNLSDILSAAQQTNSRVLLTQSHVSNIYSLLSDVDSNFQSRVPKEVASKSLLSDVNSDLASQIGGITVTLSTSDISDIASAVAAATQALTPSDISNIASAVAVAISGGGSVQCVFTVEDNGNALDGVDVWITTDIAGTNTIARAYTNSVGKVTFYLDPGTYYVWKQLNGYTFTNPEAKVVT